MAKMERRLTVMAWSHQGVNWMLREARRMMISKVIIEWLDTFCPHKQHCSNHMSPMPQFPFDPPRILHSHSQYTTYSRYTHHLRSFKLSRARGIGRGKLTQSD